MAAAGGELQALYERKLKACDAIGLLERYADKRTKVQEALQVLLSHRDEVGEALSCLISKHDGEAPLARAKEVDEAIQEGKATALLDVVPFAVSDNIETKNAVTTAGMAFLDEWIPDEHNRLVTILEEAGAACVGKTNINELGAGVTCNNATFGASRNPYNPDATSGGAAGGAAALVGSRCVPLALAVDSVGTLRVPAALCGVVGYRPSPDRYPRGQLLPLTDTMDTPGLMARSVRDVQLFDLVLRQGLRQAEIPAEWSPELVQARSLQGVKIGLPPATFLVGCEPGIAANFEATCASLAAAGAELVEAPLAGSGGEDVLASAATAAQAILGFEMPRELSMYFFKRGDSTPLPSLVANVQDLEVKAAFEAQLKRDQAVTGEEFRQALVSTRPFVQAAMARYFADNGVAAMVYPSVPMVAPEVGANQPVDVDGVSTPLTQLMQRNASLASLAGLPAVTVPSGVVAKLPVGVEFCAAAGADEALLQVARAAQEALKPMPTPSVAK